jgi:hypothetical protein
MSRLPSLASGHSSWRPEIPLGADGPLALVNLRYALAPENNFMSVSNVQSVGLMLGLGF